MLSDRDDRAKIAKRDRKLGNTSSTEKETRQAEAATIRKLHEAETSLDPDVNATGIYELCGMLHVHYMLTN